MNKERMLQLADYIENLPEHKFEMQYWLSTKIEQGMWNGKPYWSTDSYPIIHNSEQNTKTLEPLDCGTACCIAGWATAMKDNFKPIALIQDGKTIEDRALQWLDLTEDEGRNLFLTSIDTVWTEYFEKFGFELDEYNDCYTNITNKAAAYVIRDIANGVIDIDRGFGFDDSKEFLKELGHYEEDEY